MRKRFVNKKREEGVLVSKPKNGLQSNGVRWKRAITFLKKRHTWIAIIGGLMVSGTLAAKDYMSEKLKESEARIERAEALVRESSFFGTTSDKIDELHFRYQ